MNANFGPGIWTHLPEGLSPAAAAIRLGKSESMLSSRLATARRRSHEKVVRRGVAAAVSASTLTLFHDVKSVAAPGRLIESTVQIAMSIVARGENASAVVIASVGSLTQGVLKTMHVSKLKLIVSALLAALAFGGGAAVFAFQDEGGSDQQGSGRPGGAEKRATKSDSTTPARPIDRELGAKRVDAGAAVESLSWDPGGKLLATRVRAWSRTSDGATLTTGNALQIRDAETGAVLRTLIDEDAGGDTWFSPDGKSVAARFENSIKLWDPRTGKVRRTFEGPNVEGAPAASLSKIALSRDGRLIAAAGRVNDVFAKENNAMLCLWETGSGKRLWQTRAYSLVNPEPAVAFSADGKLVAMGARGTIKLWDTATGECKQTIQGAEDGRGRGDGMGRGEDGGGSSLAFSPDGKLLASGRDDKVRLWDPDSTELKRVLTTGYRKGLRVVVAFSPDGRRLAVGGTSDLGGDVQLFNSVTGRLERAFRDLLRGDEAVLSLAFSPGGETLAVGTWNKQLLLLPLHK